MKRPPLPDSATPHALPPDGGSDFNRLIHATSPYLLQHAQNPVDWYPWGDEAKARAKAEDKPIFLSIGYSSCHWCHVMEHESFENEEIAELLNRDFISVKVDREERPDVDDLYMIVTQLMTGRGGWPNSVWLLPDGRAWYAGTYFPPEDRGGQPGFKTILQRLSEVWKSRRSDVEDHASQLAESIRQHASSANRPAIAPPLPRVVNIALEGWRKSYDVEHGGFGGAPKFPPHSAIELILHEASARNDLELQQLATDTLSALARGGIHDHIGGGFHRYSTDERWILPHFEKMLYDNAQLVRGYTEAYRATGSPLYETVARGIADWVQREMTGPEGAFYSALDADSEGEEGLFYLWSRAEILKILGPDDGAFFCRLYQIEDDGNYFDEATHRMTGLNIPHLAAWPAPDASERLAHCRALLLEWRNKRVWPALDDKRITSWNGLMIGAFARAGQIFNEPRYTQAAARAATFLLANATVNGELMRIWRAGKASVPAFLDDYGALTEGLLALHAADGNTMWLDHADQLAHQMVDHFVDPATGLFSPSSPRHEHLLARMPDYFDQSFPSATSLAIKSLALLAQRGRGAAFKTTAGRALAAVLPLAARNPTNCAALLHAGRLLETDEATPRVEVKIRTGATHVAPGACVEADVQLAAPAGWALQPMKDGNPFTIKCDGDFLLESAAGHRLTLRLRPDVAAHTATTDLHLTYSACDDRACLPPETITRRLTFRVAT